MPRLVPESASSSLYATNSGLSALDEWEHRAAMEAELAAKAVCSSDLFDNSGEASDAIDGTEHKTLEDVVEVLANAKVRPRLRRVYERVPDMDRVYDSHGGGDDGTRAAQAQMSSLLRTLLRSVVSLACETSRSPSREARFSELNEDLPSDEQRAVDAIQEEFRAGNGILGTDRYGGHDSVDHEVATQEQVVSTLRAVQRLCGRHGVDAPEIDAIVARIEAHGREKLAQRVAPDVVRDVEAAIGPQAKERGARNMVLIYAACVMEIAGVAGAPHTDDPDGTRVERVKKQLQRAKKTGDGVEDVTSVDDTTSSDRGVDPEAR